MRFTITSCGWYIEDSSGEMIFLYYDELGLLLGEMLNNRIKGRELVFPRNASIKTYLLACRKDNHGPQQVPR